MSSLALAYAGSFSRLVEEHLGPSWLALTGVPWQGISGGSRELARRIQQGELQADVFLSADEQVIMQELGGNPGKEGVSWFLRLVTTELGIVYLPDRRFSDAFEEATAGKQSWWQAIQQSGLRFGRPDPDLDPKGYRTLFLFQLAERMDGVSGLGADILGAARNPAQIVPAAGLFPFLRAGELDACPAYRSQAMEEGLSFLPLPPEVNLGHEEHAACYREACYRNGDGVEYLGAPIRYAAAVVSEAANSWAAAFLLFLQQEEALAAYRAHGFTPVCRLVCAGVPEASN